MASNNPDSYSDLKVFYGDIHNHCDISYGHGSLEDALANARLQLDFVSVTVHGAWPDLPADDPQLGYLIDYHKIGFEQAQKKWARYLDVTERHNADGSFVTFPSYEWHSCEYGDHCIYFRDRGDHEILDSPNLEALRSRLRQSESPVLLLPHHIGYKRGSRGINWEAFTPEMSPVVEIFSFHGMSESSDGPYPYLHSMGPRHHRSTAQYGWSRGYVFGVVGSTDHHNAVPGSYGYGKLAVWAPDLTRAGIWDAITKRRTYALTGDRIELALSINGALMGDLAPAARDRAIDVSVVGGGSIDYVEVLHNNAVIHRENVFERPVHSGRFKVHVELGWGERDEPTLWDLRLDVAGGSLIGVEPRFRGYGPTDSPPEGARYASSTLDRLAPNSVRVQTQTLSNPALQTAGTEGLCLELEGDAATTIRATINGKPHVFTLAELREGNATCYLGGFVSPAMCMHRAVPEAEYRHRFTFNHSSDSTGRDWYTVRVRQRNDQWAWSSPIWIGELTR